MSKNIVHEILTIQGMTCINCQEKIEKKLKKTKGISYARVSFQKDLAEITFDQSLITKEKIVLIIRELGYDVKTSGKKSGIEWIKKISIIGLIIILYILLERSGILNLLVPSKLADSKMGYGALFIVGLLTSVHCISMCGGINLSQSLPSDSSLAVKSKLFFPPLLYNAGRVISYTTVGFLLGGIGMILGSTSWQGLPFLIQGLLKILAGIFMVIMGANILGLFVWLRKLYLAVPQKYLHKITRLAQNQKHPFVIGLLNALIPCGPMQAMQLVAFASGNPVTGAFSMFMFSLGTVPLMLGLGSFVAVLGKKYTRKVMSAGSVLLVVLGLAMLTQGINLSGINIFSKTQTSISEVQKTEKPESNLDKAFISEEGDIQYVKSELDFGSYPEITVYEGIPVKWTINAPEEVINGCNYRMILNSYGIVHEFTPGQNVIEFTPEKAGSELYTCWMGMIYGKINIKSLDEPTGEKNEKK